jgi:hypothetical protein
MMKSQVVFVRSALNQSVCGMIPLQKISAQ